jgi:hypothetical protein
MEGPNTNNRWWEKGDEEKKKILIERLKFFLEDYSEDESDVVRHSTDKDKKFKVRTGWFTALHILFGTCKTLGKYLPDSLIKEIDEFLKEFQDRQKERDWTTHEEMKKANYLFKEVEEYLEGKKKLNPEEK